MSTRQEQPSADFTAAEVTHAVPVSAMRFVGISARLWLPARIQRDDKMDDPASAWMPISGASADWLLTRLMTWGDVPDQPRDAEPCTLATETAHPEPLHDVGSGQDRGQLDTIAVLSREPGLLLWVLCQAWQLQRAEPRSVPQAARWLNQWLPWALSAAEQAGNHGNQPPRSATSERLAGAAAQAVRCATLSAAIADSQASSEPDSRAQSVQQAYLLGLLAPDSCWAFVLPHEPARGLCAAALVAPPWLDRAWQALDARSTAAGPWVPVVRGLQMLAEPITHAVELLAVDDEAVDIARHQWRATADRAVAHLGTLAARIWRLQQLQLEFAATLEAEKLESLAEFAAGAGHEMNNPLAVISGRAQLLLRDEQDPERRRELAQMHVQAMRVHEMIADMMLFGRPPAPRHARCDLVAIIDQVLAALGPRAAEKQVALSRLGTAEPLELSADPTQLAVAIKNLCENSIHAVAAGGRVDVECALAEVGPTRVARINVADNGPGIADDVRRHLFDPYYSGRQAGRGLGLGLSKCWRIVTNHGGQIRVENMAAGGALFEILLPLEPLPPVDSGG